ncbi:unnamed protein product [Rangifer tarandus platyrhynchus]|uniref:Uncharacterized protein n=1 Tax=Rangifer tarandus platyrhynchus TaxID=3082113 RepID=A0ABN8Y6U1_RANTA|nr:unnamed protein product [Rangifer tarandus platyrhynchus]
MAPGCRPLLPPDIRALEGEEDEPGEEMGVKQRVRSASGDRAAKADEWRPRGDGALLGCPSRGDECGRQAADRGWRPGGRPQAANAEGSQEPPQGSDQERGCHISREFKTKTQIEQKHKEEDLPSHPSSAYSGARHPTLFTAVSEEPEVFILPDQAAIVE